MEEELNVVLHDINYIPDYRYEEEQRRANEVTRQANEEIRQGNEKIREDNEATRQSYYEDIQEKVENGEFDGTDITTIVSGESQQSNGKTITPITFNKSDGTSETTNIAAENGAIYTPSINEDCDLSWTNDKGLPNPTTVNIKGDKGDKGDQGEKGETGDVGASNTLTIGTVSSGDTPSATITGESPNQVLNLVLEKGDKGDTGETGPAGASVNAIEADDEETAIALSTQNPNNIYFWEE